MTAHDKHRLLIAHGYRPVGQAGQAHYYAGPRTPTVALFWATGIAVAGKCRRGQRKREWLHSLIRQAAKDKADEC